MPTPSTRTPQDPTPSHADGGVNAAPVGPAQRAAKLGGRALSVFINRVYGLGRSRPLHPRGGARRATWTVAVPADTPIGAPVLDRSGSWSCVVRHSRAVGLPPGWPDIEGIAVHIAGDEGGDLLLAGTGDGRVARHVLVPRWSDGTCSTLLPLRTPTGPVLVRLRPTVSAGGSGAVDDAASAVGGASGSGPVWEVSWSRPGGRWHRVATLAMHDQAAPAPHFDPVERPPRGLEHYPVAGFLRRPSYEQARRQA